MEIGFKEKAILRSRIYALLATLYIEPPKKKLLKIVAELQIGADFENLMPDAVVHSIRSLVTLANEKLRQASEEDDVQLTAEFTSLFRGLRREGPLPPYESVFMEGSVHGTSTSEVADCYRQYGLGIKDHFEGEPPDHIAFELDFMRGLCVKEAKAHDDRDYAGASKIIDAEKEFLQMHIGAWVDRLCQEIKKHEKLGFYKTVADFTQNWIDFERVQINEESGLLPRQ